MPRCRGSCKEASQFSNPLLQTAVEKGRQMQNAERKFAKWRSHEKYPEDSEKLLFSYSEECSSEKSIPHAHPCRNQSDLFGSKYRKAARASSHHRSRDVLHTGLHDSRKVARRSSSGLRVIVTDCSSVRCGRMSRNKTAHPSGPSRGTWEEKADGWSSRLVSSRLAQLSSIQGRTCEPRDALDRPADPDGGGTRKPGAVCPSTHHPLPAGRYDRNFDLTSIYRDRSCVGLVPFLEVRIIVAEARRSRSLYQWPSALPSPLEGEESDEESDEPLLVALLSLPIPSKGLGGIVTTGEVTGSPVSASDCSLLSRHGSRAKGADLPPLPSSSSCSSYSTFSSSSSSSSSASCAVCSSRNKVTEIGSA